MRKLWKMDGDRNKKCTFVPSSTIGSSRKMAKNAKVTISQSTGLTPTQEQAATLLASGVSVTDVATQLDVSRATIYVWQKQTTFKCYFNRRCSDARSSLVVGLYGLANEALQTIRESLQSQNEQVRLKAAMWITDKLQSIEIAETDVLTAIRKEATHPDSGNMWDTDSYFHEDEYRDRLKELGLKETEYQSTLK